MTSALLALSACAEKDEKFPKWDISYGGNKITASFSDNGNYGFILTIEGKGKMRDYASVKGTPWYGKSGRVTDIEISEGITYVGNNSFTNTAVKQVVLPKSVTAIGEKVFPENATIYASSPVTAADGREIIVNTEHKNVLFVGNSYTYYNAMPTIVESIATSAGADVTVEYLTVGGHRLIEWADPNDKVAPGGSSMHPNTQNGGVLLEEKLTSSSDYDIVVLQEQSTYPINHYTDSFLPAVKTLASRIKATQKNCKIYLYETWGQPENGPNHGGVVSMEAKLRTAYENAAAEIGATVSYVGKAFTYIYETYNLETLEKESPMWLYQDDKTHPLYLGSFLAACVHAATLLGIDPRVSTYNGSLDGATAALLKEVAYNIARGN